jgi:NAD(P)-dependent dehydrogenase (short-subunit alcohol dehydrogenase family)
MAARQSRFVGSRVLVTGGGSGIGRAAALAFAQEGAEVVVAGRREGPLKETVAAVEDGGGRAEAVVADVSTATGAEWMVSETIRLLGGLNVAFNNAGVLGAGGRTAEVELESWKSVIGVNLTGTWLSMKYEIAYMRGQGGGTIVNTSSSIGAHSSRPGLAAYGASKAAVSALTKSAALEYIADGIRINAVSPGPVDAPMSLRPGETDADRALRLATALPIGRVGRVAEAVSAVLWLASPESGFTVGHDLVVDGGSTA